MQRHDALEKKIVAAQGEAHSGSRWLKLAGNIFTSVCVLGDLRICQTKSSAFPCPVKRNA